MGEKKSLIFNRLNSPLFVALAVTSALLLLGNPIYESNDDLTIIALLSGKTGLTAQPDGIFLSLPLSRLLYVLYGVAGAVPWYGLLLYFLLFVAFYLGLKTISLSNLPPAGTAIMYAGLAMGCFCLFSIFNFTSVSLLTWFMAAAYIARLNLSCTPPRKREAWLGFFLGMSFLVRPSILNLAVICSIPVGVTFLVPGTRKRLFYLVPPLLALVALSVVMEFAFHDNPSYRDYQRFSSARSDFTDTQMSSLNPRSTAALEKAGWSKRDYELATELWLHDDAIYSTDRIRTFLDANSGSKLSLLSLDKLWESMLNNQVFLLLMFICCATMLFSAPESYAIPEARLSTVRNCARLALVAFIAWVVVLATIRFPQRVAIPVFCFSIVMFMLFRPLVSARWVMKAHYRRLFFGATVPLLLFLAYLLYDEVSSPVSYFMHHNEYTDQALTAVQDINGPGTIFIFPNAKLFAPNQGINPLREYRDAKPFIFFPIGWLIGSRAYTDFLAKYGFGDRHRAVPAMVDNKNAVLCVFRRNDGKFDEWVSNFLGHLEQHYGQLFPGREFALEPVLDRRAMGIGWEFFRVVTEAGHTPASEAARSVPSTKK